MHRKRSTRHTTTLVATGIVASRLTGFARSVLLVAAIGGTSASPGGQIFDVANALPTNFFALIAGGVLASVLLPHLVEYVAKGQRRQLDSIVTAALLVGLLGTAALLAGAPGLVRIYAGSWPADWLRLGTWLALWCLPQVFFYVSFAVAAQLLNAYGNVVAAAWAPVAANGVACGGVAAFLRLVPSGLVAPDEWTLTMVLLTAGGATAGAVVQAAVLVVPLWRCGFRFRPRFAFRSLGRIGDAALWSFAATLAGQLAFVVTSSVSSSAGARLTAAGVVGPSLNSLSNAYLLVLVPFSVFVVAVTTTKAKALVEASPQELERLVGRLLAFVLAVMIPSVVALVVLAPVVSRMIWNTDVIGTVVIYLAPGMIPFALLYVCTRALYAVRQARLAFVPQGVVAVVTAASAVVASALLPDERVVLGVAVGIGVANAAGIGVALPLMRHCAGVRVGLPRLGRSAS